ncbi:VanZ family protein [Pleurocapsa sp. PCC 7319]|uniref:VanZ family protein n=1 Tax=Pleurocapsa sp. PCC 7319 TaxID=118161 RepID=UPI00034491FC|nr:VanZ family protein [Pleurocapsa sp. PCC 7319]
MIKYRSLIYWLLISSFASICFATIFPFNFTVPESLSWQSVFKQFYWATNIKDYIRNILLFIPLGIGLAGTISIKKFNYYQIIIITLFISAILSTNIELIQILLPSRFSSMSDIICNSLGGALGGILYCWRSDIIHFIYAILRGDTTQINLKQLAIVIASYCLVITLSIWFLKININLSNWDDDYYLAIGSEVTGKTAWKGYMTSLYICDRSLDNQEVIQAFEQTHTFFSQLPSLVTSLVFLDEQEKYSDNTQQLPDLVWQSELTLPQTNYVSNSLANSDDLDYQIHHNKTVSFKREKSLKTEFPAFSLNKKLKQSNEFSLSLTAASNRLKQVGPARIISLAESISERNLMIGQEKRNLTFRVRTPTTGDTAAQPEFIIPNIFDDYNLHQILITYTQGKLTFYIDQPSHQYNYEFRPSTTYVFYLPWTINGWRVNLRDFNLLQSQFTFYGIILLPLAILINASILLLISSNSPYSRTKLH